MAVPHDTGRQQPIAGENPVQASLDLSSVLHQNERLEMVDLAANSSESVENDQTSVRGNEIFGGKSTEIVAVSFGKMGRVARHR